MKQKTVSPYSNTELEHFFDNQKRKIRFADEKTVKDTFGKSWTLELEGEPIDERYCKIWNDNYIVSFNCRTNDEGHGYAHKRFDCIEDFKKEVFEAFNLEEPLQMSLF